MHGIVFKIDDSDFSLINKYKARSTGVKGRRYISLKVDGELVLLHRYLLNCPENKVVDHINGDSLDYRRKNLRICTSKENSRNYSKPINNTSGYKGVKWENREKKWRSFIKVDGKYKSLGYHDSPELAAIAYNQAAEIYFGEFCKINILKL